MGKKITQGDPIYCMRQAFIHQPLFIITLILRHETNTKPSLKYDPPPCPRLPEPLDYRRHHCDHWTPRRTGMRGIPSRVNCASGCIPVQRIVKGLGNKEWETKERGRGGGVRVV